MKVVGGSSAYELTQVYRFMDSKGHHASYKLAVDHGLVYVTACWFAVGSMSGADATAQNCQELPILTVT